MKKLLLLGMLVSYGPLGCAFGNRHVTLAYPPQQAKAGGQPTALAAPRPPAGKKVVLVVLLDQRSTKQAVGSVHNGFGMRTADVIAVNNVADWVTSAIKLELEKAGFEVVSGFARNGEPVVTGEVIKVYCEAWTKYEAEVVFDVRVLRGDKEFLKKSYTGKNDSTMNWGASSKSYGQALAVALANAAGNFAAEMRRDLFEASNTAPAISAGTAK
jgi:hypothetical protein